MNQPRRASRSFRPRGPGTTNPAKTRLAGAWGRFSRLGAPRLESLSPWMLECRRSTERAGASCRYWLAETRRLSWIRRTLHPAATTDSVRTAPSLPFDGVIPCQSGATIHGPILENRARSRRSETGPFDAHYPVQNEL